MTEKLNDIPEERKQSVDVPAQAIETLKASLHVYLDTLAKRPLTPRTLLELEKSAKLARQLLMVSKEATMGPQSYLQESFVAGDNQGYDAPIQGAVYQGTALSPPAETFGATAIREIVASVGEVVGQLVKPKEPPMGTMELIHAIAVARECKLTDVEEELKLRLMTLASSGIGEIADLPDAPGGPRSVIVTDVGPTPLFCGFCKKPMKDHSIDETSPIGRIICPNVDGFGQVEAP